jgi:ribosomal protein S18 acetylase RimI-like enzyme
MTSIEYQYFEGQPSEEVMGWISRMNQEIFALNETVEGLTRFFQDKPKVFVCIALQGETPIGFKVGYEESPGSFESWRSGVVESARRQGVAEALMHLQHGWCQENGFRVIKTTTNSDNHAMLALNKKRGFEVVGQFENHNKVLKVQQEKHFTT